MKIQQKLKAEDSKTRSKFKLILCSLVVKVALDSLKQKNLSFLEQFSANATWQKIYNGLLAKGIDTDFQRLTVLRLCESDSIDRSYYSPFDKQPILMCYNKIRQQSVFDQQAIFNVISIHYISQAILYYDQKTAPNANWNDLQFTTFSNIRALYISGICSRSDRKCFKSQIERRVLSKERFNGATIDLEEAINSGLMDHTPISQIRN